MGDGEGGGLEFVDGRGGVRDYPPLGALCLGSDSLGEVLREGGY